MNSSIKDAVEHIETALTQPPQPMPQLARAFVTLLEAARANLTPAERQFFEPEFDYRAWPPPLSVRLMRPGVAVDALPIDTPSRDWVEFFQGPLTRRHLIALFVELGRLEQPPIGARDLNRLSALYVVLALDLLRQDERLTEPYEGRLFDELENLHQALIQPGPMKYARRWPPGQKDALYWLCQGALAGKPVHTLWSVHRLAPSFAEAPRELWQTQGTKLLAIAHDVAAALLNHPERPITSPAPQPRHPAAVRAFAELARKALQPGTDGLSLLGRLALAAVRFNATGNSASLTLELQTVRVYLEEIINTGPA